MYRVTLTKTKKIGNIEEVVERTFKVPDWIVCPDDGMVMTYDSYFQRYECSKCIKVITAEEYIQSQLAKAKKAENCSQK